MPSSPAVEGAISNVDIFHSTLFAYLCGNSFPVHANSVATIDSNNLYRVAVLPSLTTESAARNEATSNGGSARVCKVFIGSGRYDG